LLPSPIQRQAALLGESHMPKHTPSEWTFWLSVVLVVLAVISTFVHIPYITMYAFWIAVVGFIVLVIGCTVKTA
jgi:hypothetical protein